MDADLAQCLYVSDPAGTVESSGLQELRGMSADAVAYINDNLKDQVWSTLYELSGEGCEEFQLLVGLNTTYPLRTSQAYVCHQLYQSYAEGFLGEFPYLFFAALGVIFIVTLYFFLFITFPFLKLELNSIAQIYFAFLIFLS